jgi:integrase
VNAFDVEGDRFPSVEGGVDDLIAHGLNPTDYLPEDQGRLSQELTRLEYRFYSRLLNRLDDFERNPPTPDSRIIREDAGECQLRFSDLYKQFIEFKINEKKLTEDMQKEYQRYFEAFIDLETDLPIAEIKRSTVTSFIMDKYRYLPKRNLKQYRDKSASELLQMDIPEEDLIADKTAKEAFKFIQGVFVVAVKREILTVSPARDLQLDLKTSLPYGAYTKQQVRAILESAKALSGWKYWVVLLGAYTGARLGEILQLRKVDLLQDDETSRYYIRITQEAGRVKTENANRRVPLHKKIIEAGFIEFIQGAGEKLFPEVQSQVATQWYRSYRQGIGIPDRDEYGLRLVFHSFRHTFISIARAEGNFDTVLVQELVGHEKINVGITDRYTHIPIRALCRVVDVVDFSIPGYLLQTS